MPNLIEISYNDVHQESNNEALQYVSMLFRNSELYTTSINSYRKLTNENDVKQVYEVNLSLKDITYDFKVGDAIGIVPHNNVEEVNQLMDRLKLLDVCDQNYKLTVDLSKVGKARKHQQHVPMSGDLRTTFLKYLDIRTLPKKRFLKELAEYCTNSDEKEEIKQLYDPKSTTYGKFIQTDGKSLLGILRRFPSLQPPVEILLEHLPALRARFYSISSAPEDQKLSITFSVTDLDEQFRGVCTGYLQQLLESHDPSSEDSKIQFYFRESSSFLDFTEEESAKPLILIASGTGVAPFHGFLRSRYLKRTKQTFGQTILFYGCRYESRDFLFKEEMHKYLDANILTKLYVAASRDTNEKIYVQHKIREYGREVANLLINEQSRICLCGDAENLTSAVDNALVEILTQFGDSMSAAQAIDFINELKNSKIYRLDIWR